MCTARKFALSTTFIANNKRSLGKFKIPVEPWRNLPFLIADASSLSCVIEQMNLSIFSPSLI